MRWSMVNKPLDVCILCMYYLGMNFEFDPKKAEANQRKHGVAFAEAEPVFYDDLALTREDTAAVGESRMVTVGMGALGRVLTVCWTQRGPTIRLISARLASPYERKCYGN